MSSAIRAAGAAAGCWCEACCNTNALIVKVSLPASFISEQTLIHRDTKQTDRAGGGCCSPPCHANSMDQSAESKQTRTQQPHILPHSEITWKQQVDYHEFCNDSMKDTRYSRKHSSVALFCVTLLSHARDWHLQPLTSNTELCSACLPYSTTAQSLDWPHSDSP